MNKSFTAVTLFVALCGSAAAQQQPASAPAIDQTVRQISSNPWDAVGLAVRPASEGVLFMARGQMPMTPAAEALTLHEQLRRNPWLVLRLQARPLSTAQAGQPVAD